MMVVIGGQGVGKSVRNKKTICSVLKDNLETKVKGRKVLVLDTQGEYNSNQFGKDGIPPLDIKILAVKDTKAWCRSNLIEARRIDIKSLHIDQKLEVLNYTAQKISNCMFVLEDINKITLTLSHMKD